VIRKTIGKLVEKQSLSFEEAKETMEEIMSGKATDSQIGSFLTALRMKEETIAEISAFASAMRKYCHKISPKVNGRLVDTCGTGGDKMDTFNISTTAAFVASGAGVKIAKHGNRSVTSLCGSADVLQRLGLNLALGPDEVKRSIEEVGIGFMFAPAFHPAMKHAIGPRKELGLRTVFNILGPLTNPAGASAQLIGVYDPALTEPLAKVLERLGSEEAMVVHGLDSLDEISTVGATKISWLRDQEIRTFEAMPGDFGVKQVSSEEIRGAGPDENAELTYRILNDLEGSKDPKTEIVLVNGAAGIVIGGKADDFMSGMEVAREAIGSGGAYNKLKTLVKTSGGDISRLEELEDRYG
jgi:anthranilate phosphoribosyltransferase|tara:strand:- start:3938 stop:4999 length:1062 start_codon:yes stop_codon:yes gene_type:complete